MNADAAIVVDEFECGDLHATTPGGLESAGRDEYLSLCAGGFGFLELFGHVEAGLAQCFLHDFGGLIH